MVVEEQQLEDAVLTAEEIVQYGVDFARPTRVKDPERRSVIVPSKFNTIDRLDARIPSNSRKSNK